MPKIDIKEISVIYKTGDLKQIGIKDFIIKNLKHNYKVNEFYALKNVSLSMKEGDFLGIVGINGAGKSTLLKVISQIMRPSKGNVSVEGKIAALLELGSGFDGDLTVKENTYLRGAMLGYTRSFMNQKYKEILEFSELQEFENRAFKHLSSGMKSRLAFAIACLVEPDILILDEVLSVGDGAFREKSEKKMKSIMENGVITVFVSHSLEQVRKICNKTLWLNKGQAVAFGETKEICDKYENFLKTGKII